MKILVLLFVSISMSAMFGCSKPEEPKEHFLQDQVNALDKAKEVENVLQNSLEQRTENQE